jgi:hypothetical protein
MPENSGFKKNFWTAMRGAGDEDLYGRLGGSYDPRTGSGQVPLDPKTFLPRRLPDGRIAWDVQHQVNQATLAYNRAQRDAAQDSIVNAMLAGSQARPGSRTQAYMGAAQGLANVHMQSQIEPWDVQYWGYQDDLRKQRSAARKSGYLKAGVAIGAAALAAIPTGGASLAMLPAIAGMSQAQADVEGQAAGGRYTGPSAPSGAPGVGTPAGPAGGPMAPTPGPGAPEAGQLQAGVQEAGQPPSGGPEGPPGGPEGPPDGAAEEAVSMGMPTGPGGMPGVNAYGEGLTKAEAVVSDVAAALGTTPAQVIAAAVEADPTLVSDSTIDGFLYRVQRLRQSDQPIGGDEYNQEELMFGRPYRDESFGGDGYAA